MSKGRILYVEDNFENRILIKRVLEAEDYTLLEADTGKAGVTAAIAQKPDLILMDINLPDIDGYECTAILRKHDNPAVRRIPIVALTANVMEGDHEKALAAGCDGYIAKPVDIDKLPDEVTKYLKKREPAPAQQPAIVSSTGQLPPPPARRAVELKPDMEGKIRKTGPLNEPIKRAEDGKAPAKPQPYPAASPAKPAPASSPTPGKPPASSPPTVEVNKPDNSTVSNKG